MKKVALVLLAKIRRWMRGSGVGNLPGVYPFYRWVFAHLKPKTITIVPVLNFRLFVDPGSGGLHPHLLEEGEYEPEVTRFLQKHVREGVFLDVGANIGYYTVMMSKKLGDRGKVIAIEPDPANLELLNKNIELNNCSNIEVRTVCASDQKGELSIFTDKKNRGNTSLSSQNVYELKEEVRVPCITIDALLKEGNIEQVHWIKSDIQGAELKMLKGARKTLEQLRPGLILEFWPFGVKNLSDSPEELLELLLEFGYKLDCVDCVLDTIHGRSPEEIVAEVIEKKGLRGAVNIVATM